jgi:hypothetical protein
MYGSSVSEGGEGMNDSSSYIVDHEDGWWVQISRRTQEVSIHLVGQLVSMRFQDRNLRNNLPRDP